MEYHGGGGAATKTKSFFAKVKVKLFSDVTCRIVTARVISIIAPYIEHTH
jgi:hypothetical protein